jgi:hypothetical protein
VIHKSENKDIPISSGYMVQICWINQPISRDNSLFLKSG